MNQSEIVDVGVSLILLSLAFILTLILLPELLISLANFLNNYFLSLILFSIMAFSVTIFQRKIKDGSKS